MIGSQLGNYRVTARLGEGGMGTVYRATDAMLDREVALKVLRPELARQAELVDRFRAEAVALARLRHENIAALYGLDRQGDDLVMVMEFVRGETLESRVKRAGPMPWQEVIAVMRGVLAALGHAHAKGVVHRDIKPANVMLDSDGTIKVMDFGIARLMGESRQTRAGVAIGTPSYMAPEQLRGEDVDGRTDLYAAGALLFELLTGRVAFEADSDYALMMQQLNEPPAPPGSIVAGVPRALDAAVACAMAKKPAQRFASATDFSRTLDEIAANSGSADPIRNAAATVAAKAPRDWRVYVIAASVVAASGLGVAALRSGTTPTDPVVISAVDSARNADSVAALGRAAERGLTSAEPSRPVTPTVAAGSGPPDTDIISGPVPAPVYTTAPQPEVATPPPVVRPRPPDRGATTPASPVRSPVATQRPPTRVERTPPPVVIATTLPRAVDVPRPSPAEPPARDVTPPREAEPSAGAGARRVQDLAERCVASIANNNGATAARLLRGDASGIIAAANDGRIVSASGGSVAVDMGDGRGEGQFQVRIAWRTAFGGNKSGTARLSAEVSRTDAGWNALGCRVENGGGVR